jgi:hypothetical protein
MFVDPNKAESIFFIVLSKLLMINRQRCKMEQGAQDRQFKSKIEEDWMIMNIYTILLTIAVYEFNIPNKYSILGKQVRKIPVITNWADLKLAE